MKLIVTVDTEEEFRWSEKFDRNNTATKNIKKLQLIDEIFSRYRVRPTYLIDYPVACDKDSVKILRDYYENGKCEIGAHLHTWVTPPFEEDVNNKNSYANNLPYELVRKKIVCLHEAILQAFGVEPVSFKSGRYGFDTKVARAMHSLDYKVDTSITPFISHETGGGPDFRGAGNKAYFFSHENILKEDKNGNILEVPMSVGFTRADMEFWRRIFNLLEALLLRNIPVKGILSKLGIVEKVNISPEGEKIDSIIKMLKIFIESGYEFINLNFHSSSLLEGYTPYVQNREDLRKFLETIETTLKYLVEQAGAEPLTLSEFYQCKVKEKVN